MLFTPTLIAALLDPPPAIPPAPRPPLIEPPLVVAPPVEPVKLAFSTSVKLPAAAVFVTVSACVFVPPTRWLAIVTGAGVADPDARL